MRTLPRWAYWLHCSIICVLVMQCIYGSYMVWVVFDQATPGFISDSLQAMNQNQMVNRRLYAQETWIALSTLCIYLGLTEILPRRLPSSTQSMAESDD
ncbi:MAG: hypothetical protein VX405_12450 [Myxococcota bacterium]|nr:hypothetical protein [Myxococcota bacterium]